MPRPKFTPSRQRFPKRTLSLLILPLAIIVAILPVIETFAAINRTSYQYGVTSCTEGSDLQKERCKDQSAEAMVYRMHKGIKGTSPTNPLYNTWVTNFKNGTANSKPIDLAILVAGTTSSNNQTYIVDLYQNFLCKTANQEAVAIAQWKAQLDGSKQTRAQIALHLAKQPAAMSCMRAGFLDFLETTPPDPTLDDVSVTCTTTAGQSCTVAAPQYCLSALVTQPANGTSTITGGNIVYTPSGNSTAEENYAHLRQNGAATAKCNVKIVFNTNPTLNDVSVTCTTTAGESCTVAAPQYCLSSLVTQPANGTSTVSGGNIVYTPNNSGLVPSSQEENYAHTRVNGTATAKCNVKIVFEVVDNGKRFHITHLGVGFGTNQSLFQEKVQLYRAEIMGIRPFSSYADKIVFHDANVPDSASELALNCRGGGTGGSDPDSRLVQCDPDAVEAWLAKNSIPGDRVQVIINSSLYGGGSDGGGGITDASGLPICFTRDGVTICSNPLGGSRFSYANVGPDLSASVALHEFSHSMGLADEYIVFPGPDEPPDGFYRQGQCVSTDPGPDWRMQWQIWKDIPDSSDPNANTNWHKGCTLNKNYRPSMASIMNTGGGGYNDISAHLVEQTLKSFLD